MPANEPALAVPVPLPKPRLILVRALCGTHTTRPDASCHQCHTAAEVSAQLEHEQGRCNPVACAHCDREGGPGHE